MARKQALLGSHLHPLQATAIVGTNNLADGGGAAQACVGTSLSGALQLSFDINQVSTASGQTACKLPANADPGDTIYVFNTSATAALVFPNTSAGTINGGSAGASISVAQNVLVQLVNIGGGDVWATTGNT